jgi:hypothetical protein
MYAHGPAIAIDKAGTTGTKPAGTTVDVAGRPVYIGWVCQGGTTCVATGQTAGSATTSRTQSTATAAS